MLRYNAGHMGNPSQDLRLLSSGSSNGTIGPFRGKTLQVFPADKPGTYVNVNNLFGGALRLELGGVCSAVSPTKIELEFGEVRGILWGVTVRCSSNVYHPVKAAHLIRSQPGMDWLYACLFCSLLHHSALSNASKE